MSYSEDYLKLNNYSYEPVRVFLVNPTWVGINIFLSRETPEEIRDILKDITAKKVLKEYKKLEYYFGEYWFYVLALDNLFDIKDFKSLKETIQPKKISKNTKITFYNRMASSTISKDSPRAPQEQQIVEKELIMNPKQSYIQRIQKKQIKEENEDEEESEFQALEEEAEILSDISTDEYIVKFIYEDIFDDDSINEVKKKIFIYSNILPEFQNLVYQVEPNNFISMTHEWIRNSGRRYYMDIFDLLRADKIEKIIDPKFYNEVKNGMIYLEDYSNSILLDIPNYKYDIYVFDFREIMKNFSQKDIENYTSSKIDSNLLYYSIAKKYYPQMKQENFNLFIKNEKIPVLNKTLLVREYNEKYQIMKFLQDINYKDVKVNMKDLKLLQCVLHVNYKLYLDPFLELRGIFDHFETDDFCPFIKYRDIFTEVAIKKINKNILDYTTPYNLESWIIGEHPQGIHFRIRQSPNPRNPDYERFAIVNIVNDGKVALKCYWTNQNNATFMNVLNCIESLNILIERINKIHFEISQKHRIILPVEVLKKTKNSYELSKNTEFAFFNVTYKYFPKISTEVIDYNQMDHVFATLYPYTNVVTNKETKTYQGCYLRYKRVSDYELAIDRYIKTMKDNYDFNETKIVVALINAFAKTKEEALKAMEDYNRKNNLPPPVIDSDEDLFDPELIKSIRRSFKLPGVDIEIQDSQEQHNSIKIEGVKSMKSFAKLLNFFYRGLFIFENIKNFIKNQSSFKERYIDLQKTYSREKLGKKKVVKESSNVKTLKEVDPELFDIDPTINPKKYKLYSKLCQGDRKQPIYVSEEEAKKMKGKVEYILEYPSKTHPDKINRYVCLDKDYKYPGFIQGDKHPKGYCSVCCYTSSSLDETKLSKISTFKKCMGEEVEGESEALTNIRYVKQSSKELKSQGIGKLPIILDVYINDNKTLKENKNNIIEDGTDYYLRFGIPQSRYSILSIFANIEYNSFDNQKVLKKIISFLKSNKKIFPSLENGKLINDFGTVENFIEFLENGTEEVTVDHIWNIMTYPDIINKTGFNILCLYMDQTDKLNLICPDNDKFRQFYDEKRPTVIIYKTPFNYNPIYNFIIIKNKMTINKTFKDNDPIVSKILSLYKERCFDNRIKGDEKYQKITGFDIPLPSFTIEELLKPMKPIAQLLNTENKTIGIIYEKNKEKFIVPSKPTKPLENIPVTKDILVFNLNTIIKNLNKIGETIPVKPIKYIINDKNEITTVIIQSGARIFVKNVKLKDAPISLPYERFIYDEKDIDKSIKENNIELDKRLEQIKRIKYEIELYQLYRYEISKYLNREVDMNIREKIMKILSKGENVRTKLREMDQLTDDEKREIVNIYQQNTDIKYIRNLLLDINLSADHKTKNDIIKITTQDKSDDEKKKEIVKIISKLTDKIVYDANKYPNLKEFEVSNIRQLCGANLNQKNCDSNINCFFTKGGDCKLFVPSNLVKKFEDNISYELIRNPYKSPEILNDKMEFIIDKNKFSTSKNEVITTEEKINLDDFYGYIKNE